MSGKHMRREMKWWLGGAITAVLAACGGGGGGGPVTAAGDAAQGVAITSTTATPDIAASPDTSSVPAAPASSTPAAATAPMIGDCEMFPASAIFNTRIDDTSRFPALGSSSGWVNSVGSGVRFRADWGSNTDPSRSGYWGMPINTVNSTSTDWPVVLYDYSSSGMSTASGWPHEGDCAVASGDGFALTRGCGGVPSSQRRFPFPKAGVLSEGGTCSDPNSCGDHHVLVVEQGACRLWESYFAHNLSGQWYALATAAWDLKSLSLRPATWTAADAAGLPITPLLARASEASSGEIRHALRVTFRADVLAPTFSWPGRHTAGAQSPGGIPFGALLRLKPGFVIPDSWSPQAKALALAAKRYGMYVADIGMDFYVQGEPSAQWDPAIWQQLGSISMADMEFVDLGAVTRDARFSSDSMQASW